MSDTEELDVSRRKATSTPESILKKNTTKNYHMEETFESSVSANRHQRSRRFIYLPLIVILIVIGTITGLISWYYLSMEENDLEYDKVTVNNDNNQLTSSQDLQRQKHANKSERREIIKDVTSDLSSFMYQTNDKSPSARDYSNEMAYAQISTQEYDLDNLNSMESNSNNDRDKSNIENENQLFFGKLFMGMTEKPYDEKRFNRIKGIYRSMNTKLTSTFGTLHDNEGIVCFPDTNIEFNLAVNSSQCSIVYLTRSRDDPPYLIESVVYLSSRKVIMGNPALMPIIQPAKGVIRNFRILNGGILDLRFVTLRGGSSIEISDRVGLILGGSIFQEYGGEIRLQGVLFSSTLQTYERYIQQLENPVIKRAFGGSLFTVGGTPTMIGCTVFGYLPYGDPSLNKVAIGGFALHLGGIAIEIGTFRISYNLWGNIIVIGGYRAIFHGAYDGWGIFEIGIGPIAAQQGMGIQFYVGSGVMSMVGLTRTTGHFLIQRAGLGLFTVSAGVLSVIGYEQHLARFGRAFFNIGGKFHNSIGILNVVGLLQVAVHFISQISSIGGLILNGPGIFVEIGSTRVTADYITSVALIGGKIFQGGGILISIGNVRLISRFITVGFAVGGLYFSLGGLVITIGWLQRAAVAIAYQRTVGSGFFMIGGLLVLVGFDSKAQIWIRNLAGNFIELNSTVYQVTIGVQRRLAIDQDGKLTLENSKTNPRSIRKLARSKGYPSSYKGLKRMLKDKIEARDDSSILSWMEKKVDKEQTSQISSSPSSSLTKVNYVPKDNIIGKDTNIKVPSDTTKSSPFDFDAKINTVSPASVIIYNTTIQPPECNTSNECNGLLINGEIDEHQCSICTKNFDEISESLNKRCLPSPSCDQIDNPSIPRNLIQNNFVNPDNVRLFERYVSSLSKTSAGRIKSRLHNDINENFENSWNHLQNNEPPTEIENGETIEDYEHSKFYSRGSYNKNKGYYFKNYRDYIQEGNITLYFHPNYTEHGAGLPPSIIKNAIYLFFGTDKGYSLSVTESNKFDDIFIHPENYDLFRQAGEVEPEILKPAIPKEYFFDKEQPPLNSCLSPSAYEISAMSSEESSNYSSSSIGKQTFSFYLTTFDKNLHCYLQERMNLLINGEGEDYVAFIQEILIAESQSESDTVNQDQIEIIRLNLCQSSRFNLGYEKIMGKRRKLKHGTNSKTFIETILTKSQRAKVFLDEETIPTDFIEQNTIDAEKVDISAYTGLEDKSFLSPIIHIASREDSALPASTITMGESYQIAFLYFPVNSKIQLFLMHEDNSFIPISHEATVLVTPVNNNRNMRDENENIVVAQLTWVAPTVREEGSYFFRAIDFSNPGLFTYSTVFEMIEK